MKKFLLFFAVAIFAVSLFGCGKKQEALEEEPLTMESLSVVTTAAPESKPQVSPAPVQAQARLEPLPPAGPYKPTSIEIQTALRNAGYYSGNIDGKIGAQTKKAIGEFQKANSLVADGKVGPKTWTVLSQYLNTVPTKDSKKR